LASGPNTRKRDNIGAEGDKPTQRQRNPRNAELLSVPREPCSAAEEGVIAQFRNVCARVTGFITRLARMLGRYATNKGTVRKKHCVSAAHGRQ